MAGNIYVPPSGDTSGATDANNIEDAWYAAGPSDLVILSDGDSRTVDHYYVDRVMVASSFGTKAHPIGIDHASLVGESEKTTILEAVHNDNAQDWAFPSAYIPKCPTDRYVPPWANCEFGDVAQDLVWGTPLEGEYLTDWTMRNLTVRLSNPVSPLDKDDPRWGVPRCAGLDVCQREFQAMAFWGGNGDYEFSHVTIEVSPGTTARVFGPHVMWGTASGTFDGHGNLAIKDCTIKNAWWGPIIMQSVGGKVLVSDLKTIDVGNPVDFELMFNDRNTVTESTFEYTGSRGVPERDWDGAAIQLRMTSNANIVGNQIDAPPGDLWTGVFVYYGDHNIAIRENVFTGLTGTPTDPVTQVPDGAIFSWYGSNTGIAISDNTYDPDAFAISLTADYSTIKEGTLTRDQVYVQGTNNTVKLGK